jgi:hypothetical protein
MNNGWRLAVTAAFSLAAATVAQAEPGLANKVYSPYVVKGLAEVELRGGRLTGGPLDGEQAAIVELEYGVTDRLSLAVLGEFEQHAGEARKLDAIAVEAVAYLGHIPKLGIDVGLYGEYEQRIHNESGVAEAKLLLAKQSGAFRGLVNLIVEKPLTDKPGEGATEFAYAAEATWRAAYRLRLGAQAFGDIGTTHHLGGRQPHYLGPVVQWETRPKWLNGAELEFEAAYLLPAGSARHDTDGQVRLMLEFERKF